MANAGEEVSLADPRSPVNGLELSINARAVHLHSGISHTLWKLRAASSITCSPRPIHGRG